MKRAAIAASTAVAVWTVAALTIPFAASATGWGPAMPAPGVSTTESLPVGATPEGIPQRAYQAYVNAARHPANTCGVTWTDLAAIGHIESRHGQGYSASTYSTIQADGMVTKRDDATKPGMLGPALNGSGVGGNVTPMRAPAEAAQWGIVGGWDRAVGPMQHLSSEFARNGVDGDGDGVKNPHDFDDAAASSVAHLCEDKNYSPTGPARRTAIRRYNGSGPNAERYADTSIRYADGLAASSPTIIPGAPAMAAAVPSGTGGWAAPAGWWQQVGQSWGDYGLPATTTGSWLGFLNPGGGGVAPAMGVGSGNWPSGATIAQGRPDSTLCRAGYRAQSDEAYCWPGGTAHPDMTLDLARAIRVWLKADGAPGEVIGMWRPASIPGSNTGRAWKSDHKSGLGLDIGLTAAGGSVARLDRLQAIGCKYADGAAGHDSCGIGSPPGQTACKSPIERTVWRGAAGHDDHNHWSVCMNADPARLAALIAELGGTGTDMTWRPQVQYGGTQPKHVNH